MATQMQAVNSRTKMVICEIKDRKHTAISWATGDMYAVQVMTAIACERASADLYYRVARPGEVKALDKVRGASKLPGW